jgi:aminomethyltransferase
LVPAGTGAADTLRLEAGLPRYGNDIDGTTTILEAGLEHIISWDKGDFIGREALDRERHAGPRRRLVGFETAAAIPPPRGADVYVNGSKVGAVTSAARTAFLNKTIGLACVAAAHATPGTDIGIEVEGARLSARIVPLPFYERSALR